MSTAEKNLSVVQGGMMPTLNVSNDQKLAAIRDTVAKGATDSEFMMLMHLANTYQLDPFLKEIWFIKYGSTPTIMVSRDGLRNYAMRQGDFIGMMSQEVRQGDTFKFNPITGEIHHEIGDGSGPITKCYCILKRQGKPDHTEIIDFKEYYDALSGKNGVWKSHPSAMGKKTVEVLALKKCYTITGLYAPEEMGTADHPDSFEIPNPDYAQKPPAPQVDREEWLNAINGLNEYGLSVGLTGDEIREKGSAFLKKPNIKAWTLADIASVRSHIEQQVAAYQQPATSQEVDAKQTTIDLSDEEVFRDDEDLPF